MLAAVGEFADAEIGRRLTAFDDQLTPAELADIETAATAADLLDAEPGGGGLWCTEQQEGALFSVLSLRRLAAASSAAALHLHLVALGRVACQMLGLEAPAVGTTLALSGRLAAGGASLGRWLGDAELTASDDETLADVYGTGDRLRWVADPAADWLAPIYTGGKFELALLPGRGSSDAAPHGLDGLSLVRQPASGPLQRAPLTRAQLGYLLSANHLGLVAIAQGAAGVAVERAGDYAASRRQGGQMIIGHDAVALMLADQLTALAAAAAQISAAVVGVEICELQTAIAVRRAVMPSLCDAANAAMQMHGGSGYMRDTGVEHLLRDVGSLRVMGGSPDDLGLMLAALATPAAAVHVPAGSAEQLAGHVAPTAALSLQPGFRSQPILRLMSSYQVQDPWERDTRELPRVLRSYRREIRDFAETHVEPHAKVLDLAMREEGAEPPELGALLSLAGRAGLFGDLLPRPVGSVPASRYRASPVLQQALKTEELACADGGLMLYLSANNLGLAPILFSGNRYALNEVVRPALKAAAGGEPQIFAFAITEPGAGSDAEDGHGAEQSRPGLVAGRVPGGWTLHGNKIFISGGDIARWVVAFAALEGEGFESWTAFLVDTQSTGFSRLRNEHKMGMRASGATALAFDRCFVPDELVLGGLRGGWALNRATLNFSRLPVASMAVGFARRATEIATSFACREQVAGRPLLDRQHVQLAIAEMQAETSAIRALVWQFSQRRVPEQAKASIAKFQASDRAQVVIERAMGLLGEHGLLHESGLEKVFRDNRLARIFEGTNQINRLAVIEDQQELLLAQIKRARTHRQPAR